MERLFTKYDLRRTIEANVERAIEEVKKAPEEQVLQVDADAWAESLAAQWTLVCPRVERENLHMDYPVECKVDDSAWPG